MIAARAAEKAHRANERTHSQLILLCTYVRMYEYELSYHPTVVESLIITERVRMYIL